VQDVNLMKDYPLVLGLAALPALSNFIGGLLAEVFPVSKRTLGLALHVVIGVLLAVLSLELMPRAIAVQPVWVPILAFIAGGGSLP
jgi:ZIP family zinc transporter